MNSRFVYLKKWVGGLALLVVVAGISCVAFRWSIHAGCRSQSQHEVLISTMFHDPALQLTELQKGQIRKLESDYQSKIMECCKQHCSARMKVSQLLENNPLNADEISRWVKEASSAYEKSEQATVRQVIEIAQILTSEQRVHFLKKMSTQIVASCSGSCEK